MHQSSVILSCPFYKYGLCFQCGLMKILILHVYFLITIVQLFNLSHKFIKMETKNLKNSNQEETKNTESLKL